VSQSLNEPDIDKIIAQFAGRPGSLLATLEVMQEAHPHRYLPLESLRYLAQRLRLPLARVYGVVTFYSFFNLEPQGEHIIVFCEGTACHTRGAHDLYDFARLHLGLGHPGDDDEGQRSLTTPDHQFTVRTVACFGQCALAPVVSIDNVIHGHMTKDKLRRAIDKIGTTAP
jgi:NADH-quinone oxidoreductase subunit E